MAEVRWAHREDAPRVYPLFRALIEAEGAAPPGPGDFTRLWQASFRDAQPFRFVVAEDKDKGVVGCLSLHAHFSTWKGAPVVSLEDFFVLPEQRGQGVGKAMLAFAEAYARGLGAARLELHVLHDNARAQAFYAREGFVATKYQWLHKPLPREEGKPAGGAGEGEVAVEVPPARRTQGTRRRGGGARRHRSGPAPRGHGRGRRR